MGVDVLGVDVIGVDVLGVDAMALVHDLIFPCVLNIKK